MASANSIMLHQHAAGRNLPSIAAYTYTWHEPRPPRRAENEVGGCEEAGGGRLGRSLDDSEEEGGEGV